MTPQRELEEMVRKHFELYPINGYSVGIGELEHPGLLERLAELGTPLPDREYELLVGFTGQRAKAVGDPTLTDDFNAFFSQSSVIYTPPLLVKLLQICLSDKQLKRMRDSGKILPYEDLDALDNNMVYLR